jgi:hypothetical protein
MPHPHVFVAIFGQPQAIWSRQSTKPIYEQELIQKILHIPPARMMTEIVSGPMPRPNP